MLAEKLGRGVGIGVNKVHYGLCEKSECKERRIGRAEESIFQLTLQIDAKAWQNIVHKLQEL